MANITVRFSKVFCPYHGAFMTIIPVRTWRYHKWGGSKRGRNKIPLDWRKVDHNPAKLPWAWIPDDWEEKNTIDYDREKELEKYIPGYETKVRDIEHPDYHERVNYSFVPDTKLIEGFKQALCLTKSVLYEEMPSVIQQLTEVAEIPDQDDKVIKIFQHAHLFDIDPENFDTKNRRQKRYQDNFKIFPTVGRYCPLILENLIRLCYQHPYSLGCVNSRMLAKKVECSTYVRRVSETNSEMMSHVENDWLVSFKSGGGMQLLSKFPMQPFVDSEVVDQSASIALPNTFPVLPVVDLAKTNIYQKEISSGLVEGAPISNMHTLFLLNLNGMTAEELYGQMTCQLFACLHSRAVSKYGSDPIDLEEPVCGQAIGTDGQDFQFLCMQLNTTKLDSDKGIKNMVWTNAPSEDTPLGKRYLPLPMYQSCSHRDWQSPGYYTGYDPSVFKYFLAMWLNGSV